MNEGLKKLIIWFIAYFVGVVAHKLVATNLFIAVILVTVGYLIWAALFDFWFL